MSQHSSNSSRPTVATIRRRLILERNLPLGVEPNEENMFRYYGELPSALPGPRVTYNITARDVADAERALKRTRGSE